MIATPDGERLLFSMVPNMFEWASAILGGTLDPTTEEGRLAGRDMVQTMFFTMDLDTADFYFLGEDVNQASLNTALYGN